MTWTCLDLFAGLGGFSADFEDSNQWDVVTVDAEAEFEPDICADVLDLRPSEFDQEFDVVLAGHPCTEFSTAQNMNGDHDPDPDHVAMAFHTVGLIEGLNPEFWFLENPKGRLRSYLGRPQATVTYCQYGRPYMKPTDLWGNHPPMQFRRCSYGDDCHVNHRDGCNEMRKHGRTAAEKSLVPNELSEQIRDACERALTGETPQQVTINAVTDGGETAALSSTDTAQEGDSHE